MLSGHKKCGNTSMKVYFHENTNNSGSVTYLKSVESLITWIIKAITLT